MTILNTQRNSHFVVDTGKTKSSRDFQWINKINHGQPLPISNLESPYQSLIDDTIQKDPTPLATFIFQRAKVLMASKNQADRAYRVLTFLIHLHDEQRFTRTFANLDLLSQAFLMLATYELTAYHNNALPASFTAYINAIVRADFLSPKKDMANVLDCLKNRNEQGLINQHPDGRLLFSRLYHLLPLSQQRPVLLSWLANEAFFNHQFPEIDLQLFLLSSAKSNTPMDPNAIYSKLTSYCIDYVSTDDPAERAKTKQALEGFNTDTAKQLRFNMALTENEEGLSPPTDSSNTTKRLQINANTRTLTRIKREITHMADGANIEALETQKEYLKEAAVNDIRLLIESEETPTLSQIKGMISLLLNKPDTDAAFVLANQLLTSATIRHHYEHTPEYQAILGIFLHVENKNGNHSYQAIRQAIHQRPFYTTYYHDYAFMLEGDNGSLAFDDHRATLEFTHVDSLRALLPNPFPNENTTIAQSKEIMSIVFSKDLLWLNKHFPVHAGLLHRSALVHWHFANSHYDNSFNNETIAHIKHFYPKYQYETFRTIIEGWPDNYKKIRFDAFLTLAKTLNLWRCYKVLFLNAHWLAQKSAEDIYKIIETLPETRLLKRALLLCSNPSTALSSKMEDYKAKLDTLKSSLTHTNRSVTDIGQFQPQAFETLIDQASEPNGALRYQQDF